MADGGDEPETFEAAADPKSLLRYLVRFQSGGWRWVICGNPGEHFEQVPRKL
jgi:hypothetical protein